MNQIGAKFIMRLCPTGRQVQSNERQERCSSILQGGDSLIDRCGELARTGLSRPIRTREVRNGGGLTPTGDKAVTRPETTRA
jgi:hypothetical protein